MNKNQWAIISMVLFLSISHVHAEVMSVSGNVQAVSLCQSELDDSIKTLIKIGEQWYSSGSINENTKKSDLKIHEWILSAAMMAQANVKLRLTYTTEHHSFCGKQTVGRFDALYGAHNVQLDFN